jgi:hypothetical protein
MSKREKRKHGGAAMQHGAALDMAAWRARVESLLAAGQTRAAVEAAKQCGKHCPGPAADTLVVLAYEARIQALIASGLAKEAQALCDVVSERFPAFRDRLVPLVRRSEMLTGNFEPLLRELLTAEGPRQRELEAILTRELTDPAIVADSPILPHEHPLKCAAGAVRDLFTAVTTGPLPAGALAPLDSIPRRSPFAPWKLLIRALDAFYRHADADVLANLAGIPPEAGPARLAPVLRRLVGTEGETTPPSFAVTSLLEKVGGPWVTVMAQLPELSQALAARDERRALAAVRALVPVFDGTPTATRRTFLATLLQQWARHDLPPQGLLRLLPRRDKDLDVLRLSAIATERVDWEVALELWDQYLRAAIATGALPATGPATARVLLHMAALFPEDVEEIYDLFDVDSGAELQKLIQRGALPPCYDRGQLLERARTAEPAPQVFRALLAHYDQGDPKRAEGEAETWRRAHPQDVEPVLYLARAAERRGALRKALDLLAEAEALNRVHPEVRQRRFRLLLASAERRIKEAKALLALADLERVAHEPRASEGELPAYVLALRWAATTRVGDAAAATELEHTLATTIENPVLRELVVSAVARAVGLSSQPSSAGASPLVALDGLARACELFRMLERPFTAPAVLLTQVEQALGNASAAQLYALCRGGMALGRPALTYLAAGQGLMQDSPLMHRFLLARGQVLQSALWEQGRARACLRAARELAARARDMDAVREASAALDTRWASGGLPSILRGMLFEPEESLSPEYVTTVLTTERQHRALPRFPREKVPRKRTTRRPRRSRQRFDGLLDLLEGNL